MEVGQHSETLENAAASDAGGSSKTGQPRVSIVMAAYNASTTIGEAIESIIAQTYKNWELIVVNDASTDDTASIVRSYTDCRIRLVCNAENRGAGHSRNVALEQATGPYFAVMDADDRSHPHRLERQVDVLSTSPEVVAVGAQIAEFGDWGGPVVGTWPTDPVGVRLRQQAQRMPLAPCVTMFRTEVMRSIGGYDAACERCEDYAAFLKLGEMRMACVNEVLLDYRTVRPLPYQYVRRELRHADFARIRFRHLQAGKPVTTLPQRPYWTFTSEAIAFRAYAVRRVREVITAVRLRRKGARVAP